MTSGLSTNVGKNAALDGVFGSAVVATFFYRLWTVAPALDGTGGTECTGNGYAAVGVTNNQTNFPEASGGVKTNGVTVTFPAPSGTGWGAVAAVTLHDAATAGNMYCLQTLSGNAPIVVGGADPAPTINAGDLLITIT